jgi:hypothetical protein
MEAKEIVYENILYFSHYLTLCTSYFYMQSLLAGLISLVDSNILVVLHEIRSLHVLVTDSADSVGRWLCQQWSVKIFIFIKNYSLEGDVESCFLPPSAGC